MNLSRILAVQSLFISSASFRYFGVNKPSSLLLHTFSTKKSRVSSGFQFGTKNGLGDQTFLKNNKERGSKLLDLTMRSKSYGDFYEGKSLSPIYYPKSENQKVYYAAVNNPEIPIVLGVGAAGTGKTLFALTAAINALKTGKIQKIVLTRPIVPVDEEELGFLPGI
jgi:predicted ribonuclease YlaK